jgi:hypothetical protein
LGLAPSVSAAALRWCDIQYYGKRYKLTAAFYIIILPIMIVLNLFFTVTIYEYKKSKA